VLRRIYAAYRGSRLWAGLERKYEVDQGMYVVLMPEDDAELNAVALGHVADLVADRRARGVVLVHSGAAPAGSAGIVGTESWTGRRIDALIAYHELHNFSDRLLIVSLTKPFGNGLHHLLGRQGVTKEDLVCLGCFRLRGYGMAES
jgi:hypothetical protein